MGGLSVLASSHYPLLAFVLGTFAISLSAFVFLVFVSWLRRDKLLGRDASMQQRADNDAKEEPRLVRWTFGLFAVALAVAIAVWISPTTVGWILGSMVVAYLAMGSLMATANIFHYGVRRLVQSGSLGRVRRPGIVSASIGAALILLAVINAWLQPLHEVRRFADKSCADAAASDHPCPLDRRPSVEQAAQAWYQQAKIAFKQDHPDWQEDGDVPLPMLIVATAGGGIRAAYWTAAVLDKLTTDKTRPYLFAVSGVSGGSVGATAFEAALAMRDERKCPSDPCPLATKFLNEDFLAPVLASGVFVDTVASFLPDLPHADRGVALEKSFEEASDGWLAQPFLSLSPFAADGAIHGPWRPILLLNATHEESGRRIIAGQVLVERNVFLDSFDELHEVGGDVRASTAAHNSARFAYVSPAGDLGGGKGSMIDGGYFENYGALTALELAGAAEDALGKHKVKVVYLLISSDPDLDNPREGKRSTPVRINEPTDSHECLVSITEREAEPGRTGAPNYLRVQDKQVEDAWLNEFVAPLQGLENARAAQGNRAAAQLAVSVCQASNHERKRAPGGSDDDAAQSGDTAALEGEAAHVKTAGKNYVVFSVPAASADEKKPYFAHVAMCRGDNVGNIAVNPPLGWVLSRTTRAGLDAMLCRCGNIEQMTELQMALSLPKSWTCRATQDAVWPSTPQRDSASR
jgi:hypothetical protein